MFSKNTESSAGGKFYKSWKFIASVSAIVALVLTFIVGSTIRDNRRSYFLNTTFNNAIQTSAPLLEEIFLSSDPDSSDIRTFNRLKSSTLSENNPIRKYNNFVNLLELVVEVSPSHPVTLNEIYNILYQSKP
jgi:hypothetical protein